ncbi:MAG: hypothetical protein LIO92_08785 [Clostridiales bacterium]|nr:hypothetical protein [Clostridiales bacterium]
MGFLSDCENLKSRRMNDCWIMDATAFYSWKNASCGTKFLRESEEVLILLI